jgi:hypothetical protein
MLLVQYTDMRGMERSGARAFVVIVVEVGARASEERNCR